jgi:hypothetical protein
VSSSQATAQNSVSHSLLGLSEDERNETFTHMLCDSNVKCDQVIRTLFNGATTDLDVWEALCRDRNSYLLSITPEPNFDIELVSCRELLATSKMLLERAGGKTKPTGCRMKRAERLCLPLQLADASFVWFDLAFPPPSPHEIAQRCRLRPSPPNPSLSDGAMGRRLAGEGGYMDRPAGRGGAEDAFSGA